MQLRQGLSPSPEYRTKEEWSRGGSPGAGDSRPLLPPSRRYKGSRCATVARNGSADCVLQEYGCGAGLPVTALRRMLSTFLLIWVWMMAGAVPSHAAESVPPDLMLQEGNPSARSLAGYFSVLRDPEGRLTLEQVIAARGTAGMPALPGFVSFGFTGDAVWLHVRVISAASRRMTWVLELRPPFVDHVSLYSGLPGQTADAFRHSRFGDLEPLSGRTLRTAQFASLLTLDPGEVRDLYIRIASSGAVVLRGSVSEISVFTEANTREDLVMGAVYGTFALICLMNLIYYLWLRDNWYVLYGIYVACSGLAYLALSGYMPFLFGDSAVSFVNPAYSIPVMLSSLFGGLFANVYLRLKQQMPWMHRTIITMIWMYAAAAICSAAGYYGVVAPVILPVMLVQVYLSIGAGLVLYRRGYRPAGIFCVAFVLLALGGAINVSRTLGILEPSLLADNATLIGMSAHMVVMMLGLAMRVRDAEAERALAQSDLAALARSAERRAIQLVEERTRELAMAKEQLEASLRAERQAIADQIRFIDMISHEYRTPVSVLNSSLDTLAMRLPDPASDGERILDRMRRAMRRLTEVIEVGLQQQRMDGHVMRLYPVNTDLQVLVAEVVQAFRAQSPEREIRLTGVGGAPASVIADEEMMETLFRNLIGNALKYSPAETAVEVRLSEDGGVLVVEVEDRGRGIPEQDLPRVFEKYARGSNTQGVAGTGFGLYMARKLVNLHGGTIQIFSHSGAGTTVRVGLPKADPAAEAPSLRDAG